MDKVVIIFWSALFLLTALFMGTMLGLYLGKPACENRVMAECGEDWATCRYELCRQCFSNCIVKGVQDES